jgi:beta-eliminating lyase
MVASAGRRGGGQAFIQRRDRAYRGASRMLTGYGRRTQAEWLRELAGCVELNSGGIDPLPDHYGAGPQVTELEQEVAALLGKPAAVLMPSGIMAQQAALRAWAERSGRTTVGLHLKSHFLVHELDALANCTACGPSW